MARKPAGSKSKSVSSSRVRQKRADIRRDILAAARTVLEAGGIEAVTLAAVAGQLQLTKQALYHYFPSKEALVRNLTSALLKDEIDAVLAAVENSPEDGHVLETMIRAFYAHYIDNMDAFRTVYCRTQLMDGDARPLMDTEHLRTEVNPVTRHFFDVLEARLARKAMPAGRRKRLRRLAFSAWLAALGMMTMRSLTDALNDPLIHADKDILDTLAGVFNTAAGEMR